MVYQMIESVVHELMTGVSVIVIENGNLCIGSVIFILFNMYILE